MSAGLPLMKSVLITLTKSVFIHLRLTAQRQQQMQLIQKKKKKKILIGNDCTDNLESRNGRYHKNI